MFNVIFLSIIDFLALIGFLNWTVKNIDQTILDLLTYKFLCHIAKMFKYLVSDIHILCLLKFCSADSIERAFQILDQIPGRATGAYSHSQVIIPSLEIFVTGRKWDTDTDVSFRFCFI